MNDTVRKFGYPATLIREYDHWVVLLRPAQVTLGSLILAARSEATAFGALPVEAHADLANATRDIETALSAMVGYDRINYLMLMMVDPHVHFHVIPRYDGDRSWQDITLPDRGWPKPPELGSAVALDEGHIAELCDAIRNHWPA